MRLLCVQSKIGGRYNCIADFAVKLIKLAFEDQFWLHWNRALDLFSFGPLVALAWIIIGILQIYPTSTSMKYNWA